MQKLSLLAFSMLFLSCVNQSPYLWLKDHQISKEIEKINQKVDELNNELMELCKNENKELVSKVSKVSEIKVSIDGRKIFVSYETDIGKISKHNEFNYSYVVKLSGEYRDKEFGTSETFDYYHTIVKE